MVDALAHIHNPVASMIARPRCLDSCTHLAILYLSIQYPHTCLSYFVFKSFSVFISFFVFISFDVCISFSLAESSILSLWQCK